MGAVMSPVFDQLNEGVIQLARFLMLCATNGITTSIINRSHVSLSMVAIGESIFARAVNQKPMSAPSSGKRVSSQGDLTRHQRRCH